LRPVWEGHHEGLQTLQLLNGDFGFPRVFAIVVSGVDTPAAPSGSIQLYELVKAAKFDQNPNGEARISWQFETPAYTWGDEFQLKKLVSAEFWVDRLFGEVIFKVEYRPDGETCWQPWHEWEVCSARNSCENVIEPICYPIQQYGEGYRQTMALPLPPQSCAWILSYPWIAAIRRTCETEHVRADGLPVQKVREVGNRFGGLIWPYFHAIKKVCASTRPIRSRT
jgi:hypothetical protein